MSDIVVAPFSHSDIRDWPTGHFAAMIGLLLERIPPDMNVRVVGTPGQKLRACEVVRHLPTARVSNECGRMTWAELIETMKAAACLIGNNSGLAHLSGRFGVPTVSVFGGSHQRGEWRALGFNVITVSRAIGCSPCQLDHGQASPYDKACLRLIEPATVVDAAMTIMARVAQHRRHGTDRSVVPEAAVAR